jgi:hypothetical protein
VPLLQVSAVGQGDGKARFLADFRALRDGAALDFEELAARAHYPCGALKEAEAGPGLPGLPVLAAYVRACGGDVLEWEERWRRLDSSTEDDEDLPVRPAGASPAAAAGARAGVTIAPAEVHNAERIKAALRAHGEREEQPAAPRLGAAASTLVANGNSHIKQSGVAGGGSVPGAKARLATSRSADPVPTAWAAGDSDSISATTSPASQAAAAGAGWGSGPRADLSTAASPGRPAASADASPTAGTAAAAATVMARTAVARARTAWQKASTSQRALALLCAVIVIVVLVIVV